MARPAEPGDHAESSPARDRALAGRLRRALTRLVGAGRPAARAAAELARDIARKWRSHRGSGRAGEVAFFWILGLFPALIALAAVLGVLEFVVGDAVARQAQDEVVTFLQRVLTDEASGMVDGVRNLFTDAKPATASFGVVAAVWAASRGFAAMIQALGDIYDVVERRSYLRVRLLAVGMAGMSLLVVAVVLAMMVLGPLLGTGRDVARSLGFGPGFATLWDWLRWPVAVTVVIAWAATVYHLASSRRTPWPADLPGAVLSAAVWAGVSVGLQVYLRLAANANPVLGALGGSLIVLLWLYLLAAGLLLGAELNAAIGRRSSAGQHR